jgi:hypothetical protein
MKKITTFLFLIALFTNKITAQTQTFQWAKSFVGSPSTYSTGNKVVIDSNKNVYTLGYFTGTTDFDPSAAVYNLTPTNDDLFITKMDVSGNFIWTKQIGGIGVISGTSLAIDLSDNIYISGFFNSTVDFDPGTTVYNLSPINNAFDAFITKLDSTGNFVWAKQFGSTSATTPIAMSLDTSGNIFIAGYFSGTTDFDPSTTGTTSFTSNGFDDIFIGKLNASGDLIWAKKIGGLGYDYAGGLVLDSSQNFYITGRFSGTVDFDPNIGVSNLASFDYGTGSSYILKMNDLGNYVWAKKFTGTKTGEDCVGVNIALDASNNVYTTGYFKGNIDFDPDLDIAPLTSAGVSNDIYISKLNTSGNYVWAKKISSNSSKSVYSIATDNSNNVYTFGHFQGTVNFNPNGTDNINAFSSSIFINKLDNIGNYISTKIIGTAIGSGSQANSNLYGGLVDKSNNTIYATGSFSYLVDFDPDAGVANLSGSSFGSAFVFKYGTATLGLEDYNLNKNSSFKVYPNPNKGQFHIALDEFEENSTIEIHDILGQKCYEKKLNAQNTNLDFNLNKGIYFLSLVKDTGKKSTQKIIIE